MKLNVELNLASQEENELRKILKKDASEWPAGLKPYAEAAALEYIRMFLGQKVFTRGSDIREYRLFLLIRTAFKSAIPDEQTVCALFQCTLSQSRGLLRAVMSKYQYELSEAITGTLTELLRRVKKNVSGALVVTINNESVVGELNKVLTMVDAGQDQVARQTGKLATYELKPDAYRKLCENFGIPASAIK
ncbi:MAG: hypothetical protein QOH39_3387 [Verrucomicrobiota bacterium]|jgi:hypothetical protein